MRKTGLLARPSNSSNLVEDNNVNEDITDNADWNVTNVNGMHMTNLYF